MNEKPTKLCKECEEKIPKKASRCKHCGAKQPRPFWKNPWFYVLLFIFGPIIMATDSGNHEAEKKVSNRHNIITEQKAEKKVIEEVSNWEYSENEDEMDGSKSYYAITNSTNEVDFDFPYNGGTSFFLTIRNKKGKDEALLRCSKCQFIGAGVYDNETLRIKFDEEQPANYGFTGPADYSSDVVFIGNSHNFIQKLKSAKKLMIEAPFYDSGRKVIYFNISDLKWDK